MAIRNTDGTMLSIMYSDCHVFVDVSTTGEVSDARVLLPSRDPEIVAHDGTNITVDSPIYSAILEKDADSLRDEYEIELTKEA